MQGYWVVYRRRDVLLCLLHCQGRVGYIGLEVGHIALQFADRLLLLADLRLGRVRLGGRVGRSGLDLLHSLILALQCIAQFLDLPPLLCYGGLLRGNCVLQCLHIRRCNGRSLGLFGFGRCAGLCHQRRCQKRDYAQLPCGFHYALPFFSGLNLQKVFLNLQDQIAFVLIAPTAFLDNVLKPLSVLVQADRSRTQIGVSPEEYVVGIEALFYQEVCYRTVTNG